MKKTNLFIVGAPKSGTTTMFELLKQHPDIFAPENREPNFFCQDINRSVLKYQKVRFYNRWFYRTYVEKLEEYKNIFNKWGDEKYALDGSSGRYLYSKEAAQEIAEFNSDAKVLIMIRNPIDFLRSLHSHFVTHFSEDIVDFKKALEAEKERKQGRKIPKGSKCPAQQFYSEISKFSEQITRFKKYFPEEQVKIIILDDFKDDMQKVFQEVLDFLGINVTQEINYEIKNVNKKVSSKWMGKFLVTYPFVWKFCKKILPISVYQKIRNKVIKPQKREKLDVDFRKELEQRFKEEVESLSKITKRDLLSLWGFT